MKTDKVIGILLGVLAVSTVVGMALQSQAYWDIYNYATILFSVPGSIALLRKK